MNAPNAPLLLVQPMLAHARVPDTSPVTRWGDEVKRILCVRLDNLGDVLMTTPALHALREGAPGRHLTLLGSKSGVALAPFLDDVDDVIEYDAPSGRESAYERPHARRRSADAGALAARRLRRGRDLHGV